MYSNNLACKKKKKTIFLFKIYNNYMINNNNKYIKKNIRTGKHLLRKAPK